MHFVSVFADANAVTRSTNGIGAGDEMISKAAIYGNGIAHATVRTGLRGYLLGLPRAQKRGLQLVVDTLLIWFCLWLAFYLRLGSVQAIEPYLHGWLFALAPMVTLPIFVRFGLYRVVVHCLGYQALMALVLAVSVASILLICAIYVLASPADVVPRSIIFIYWMLCLLVIGGLRVAMRQYFGRNPQSSIDLSSFLSQAAGPRHAAQTRVVIFGAGAAGTQLLFALRQGRRRQVVAFLDDNPQLVGRYVAGVLVYAPDEIACLVAERHPEEILLAIPSAPRSRRAEIVDLLAPFPVRVRTVPGLADLASGRVKADDLQEVGVADLLGRDPVEPDMRLFERCIRDQVVMVTGAGGSIGSELCRQIIRCAPRTLLLFDQSEYNLYRIHREMEGLLARIRSKVHVVPILGSVCDQKRVVNVMVAWRVDTIYHAAAYKHVPMVEHNVAEGIVNNVFGTLHCAQAALQAGVRHFVLISTDKAVRPTNIMGGTKRLAEMVLQALAQEVGRASSDGANRALVNRTRFIMVRFGNVLGSSGSVIPLFQEQIRRGGPVTVTHPEITRYFMTIPEAAQLVIQAGSMGQGGDVFVLDMGAPVKIVSLAEKMITLSGLSTRTPDHPEGDIAIEFVGLRPGEKLYEELLIGDNVTATEHPMIMRASEKCLTWEALKSALDEISESVAQGDYARIHELFCSLVEGYPEAAGLVDWVHQEELAVRNEVHALKPAAAAPARRSTDWPARARLVPVCPAHLPANRAERRGSVPPPDAAVSQRRSVSSVL
jgi:FlaA1/EpsC-like NDP-sugar epimerase